MPRFRYTFGMIVFNGDPFVRQAIESVYDFAHEIIIAEGADENALPFASPEGGSTDRTVEIIRNFPDPEHKITLIQGRWRDKDHQSNAWIERATGDYVWQLDDDEIYKTDDLYAVDAMLAERPDTTAVSFHWCNFFGGFERIRPITPETPVVWRLFKFTPGARWASHRPPDILDSHGRSLRTINPITAGELVSRGIYIYHCSYVTDRQIRDKTRYMERVRMREYDCGMDAHPWWARYRQLKRDWSHRKTLTPLFAVGDRYFRWWGRRPGNIARRKRADTAWNYDFYENVWLPWKRDPAAVEGKGLLSPNIGMSDTSVPYTQYTDSLPEPLSRFESMPGDRE